MLGDSLGVGGRTSLLTSLWVRVDEGGLGKQGLLPDYFFLTGRYRVYFHGYDTSSDKNRVFSTAA